MTAKDMNTLRERRLARLRTPGDLDAEAVKELGVALNRILADVFALYLKTKNFHWHISGPHFRDYHLLLDEQADQIFAMTDAIAERVRKVGAPTLKSIGQIAKEQRILDNDADYVEATDMLAELREDNAALLASLRAAHDLCDTHRDVGTASLLEVDRRDGAARVVPLRVERPHRLGRKVTAVTSEVVAREDPASLVKIQQESSNGRKNRKEISLVDR
jgi:starvation-inducible DNA-binding protein